VRLSSQQSQTVISPIPLGLDPEALTRASPRLWVESSSPDTILGHKSTCSESQRLGSPDIAVLNSVLLRATARRSTPPLRGGCFPHGTDPSSTRIALRSTGSISGAAPSMGVRPSRVGLRCRGGGGSDRGSDRARQARSQPRAEAAPLQRGADPTGGRAAAPGLGPGLIESAGRCAGRCAGWWSQP